MTTALSVVVVIASLPTQSGQRSTDPIGVLTIPRFSDNGWGGGGERVNLSL